jgi:hypothetical protein
MKPDKHFITGAVHGGSEAYHFEAPGLTLDGKGSHCLWQGELKMSVERPLVYS